MPMYMHHNAYDRPCQGATRSEVLEPESDCEVVMDRRAYSSGPRGEPEVHCVGRREEHAPVEAVVLEDLDHIWVGNRPGLPPREEGWVDVDRDAEGVHGDACGSRNIAVGVRAAHRLDRPPQPGAGKGSKEVLEMRP